MFPFSQPESEQAAELRLELMAELAEEVGEQRFVRAVRDAIKVSHKRWDCSVARVREMAGLRHVPPPSATATAWEFVTQVFIDHVRTDPAGNYVLEEKWTALDGVPTVKPVPFIPFPIKRAVQGMGGWAALAESWPEFWTSKLRDFRELYHTDSGLCVDRPDSSLERSK